MPIPKPSPGEPGDDFLARCMGDETMVSEYPDQDQRYAICQGQLTQAKDERLARIKKMLKEQVKKYAKV